MNTFLIIIGIFVILYFIGRAMTSFEDDKALHFNSDHPGNISKTQFPVGSGQCSARKNFDRHIWEYKEVGSSVYRECKYCGIDEHRLMSTGEWIRC